MEIQLTKTKTITIGGGGSTKHRTTDVVGIDLFSGDSRGCPAVRIAEKKGVLTVISAGFVPAPEVQLPTSWDEASKPFAWQLPSHFQAPTAALAVTSGDMLFAQTTADAFKAEIAAAGADAPAYKEGEPFSHGGRRFVMAPMTPTEGFVLEASLPEYQTLWLSRLLPEGRRPTASSIQLRTAALSAALSQQPGFKDADTAALAVIFDGNSVYIAGYKAGDLALWRQCRGVPGYAKIRETVKQGLGLDDEMVDNVLEENLIDPRPVLEPVLAPLLVELAQSRDYLVGKLGVELKSVYIIGFRKGSARLAEIAADRLHINPVTSEVFAGLNGAPAEVANDPAFLGALGAALSAMGKPLNLLSESEILSSSPVRIRVMAPILALLATLGMLVWWGMLFGQYFMVSTSLSSTEEDLARGKAKHETVMSKMLEANELESQAEQLAYYRASRHEWSGALTALAEVMPVKIQLQKLEIPPPPPQNLANPKGPKYPPLWGPTSNIERVSLILSGRTTKEIPVISLMESLESDTFTNTIRIVKDPRSPDQSPKVHSFKQDATARTAEKRLLTFEIEYLAKERRFAQ